MLPEHEPVFQVSLRVVQERVLAVLMSWLTTFRFGALVLDIAQPSRMECAIFLVVEFVSCFVVAVQRTMPCARYCCPNYLSYLFAPAVTHDSPPSISLLITNFHFVFNQQFQIHNDHLRHRNIARYPPPDGARIRINVTGQLTLPARPKDFFGEFI